MKKRKILFIIIVVSSVLPSVGHSSWHLVASKDVQYSYNKIETPVVAVAYIKYSDSNKLYTTTIERALELAAVDTSANTIYVVPETNPTITRDTTVASNDTLIIPIKGETTGEEFDPTIANGIADSTAANVTKNRKNSVKIADGITLNVDGKLIISGQSGKGGGGHTGFTSGSYTEIVMGSESKININGFIDNYGYIKEFKKNNNSKIYVHSVENSVENSVGKLSMPLVFYDFRGGSYSAAAADSGNYVFPFTLFDFPNIQSKMIFNKGAILEGKVVVPETSKSKASRIKANVIGGSGTTSLFRINEGSMSLKYTPVRDYSYPDNNFTTNDAVSATSSEASFNKTNIDIFGSVNFASLEMNVGVNINSANFFLPLSYKYQIKVKENGIMNIANKMKFYKGALIEVEPGGTGNINAETIFYQEYFDKTTTGGKYYPSYFDDISYTARLINNGKLNIKAPFAGKIETTTPGAKVIIDTGFKASVDSKEMISATRQTFPPAIKYNYTIIKGYAVGDISSDVEEKPKLSQFSTNTNTEYVSQGLWWLGTPGLTTHTTEEDGGSKSGKMCIDVNVMVLMHDGTTKQAGLLVAGDMVKVFNHETGQIDIAPILFNDDIDKPAEEYNVVYLNFSNGKQIKLVDEHGFFDINTMKYEYIDEFNYSTFVGHKFASITNDKLGVSILESAYIKRETLRICSPVSYFHLNLITEEILSIPGGISGLFNIFDYGENLQYDEIRKNSDIEQFGLFTFEDFENKIPLEFYQAFPTPYLKVSIGKGMITMEDIDYLIDRYLPIASEQQGQ